MRTRRIGLFREDWYSICSRHQHFDETCELCAKGCWVNRWSQRINSLFYRICPWGWRLWINRRGSPARKRLESMFPGLRDQN